MYFNFKTIVREKIKEKHGQMRTFIASHPELNLNESKLSKILNPSSNCELSTIAPIAEALGYEITIKKVEKIKAWKKTG